MLKAFRTRSGLIRMGVLCCLIVLVGAAVASAATAPNRELTPPTAQIVPRIPGAKPRSRAMYSTTNGP